MALSEAMRKLVSNASSKYSRSSGKTIKPKEGVNRYRILVPTPAQAPWMPANGQFFAELGVHWIKAEENGKPLVVVGCESICHQKPSAIAPAIDKAIENAIDEESKKLYQSWRAKTTILLNVLDRSKGSTTGDEPQLLELTPTTFAQVMGLIQQFDAEGEDILDPNEGMDISITRTGKGLNTEYQVNTAPGKSAPVPAAAFKALIDPFAHIEKEFFRGEEQKALNTIAQIAGVDVGRLSLARTPTPALSSSAASVADADGSEITDADLDAVAAEVEDVEVTPAPAPKAAAKPAAAAPKPAAAAPATAPAEEDLDTLLEGLDEI